MSPLSTTKSSIEDPPCRCEIGLGRFYLACLRDPCGNNICALHRG